ncbi:MAG TPA: hypothetical protein VKB88_24075 [Bryobacteraceae bacterium]|nr:hypothetical protein [Bryobacteraceae bacterium]
MKRFSLLPDFSLPALISNSTARLNLCRAILRHLLFLVPVLASAQVAPDVSTNIQLENFVFYMDQTGDATKFGTLPGPVPTDPQLGVALRRYAIIADITSIGGKPAAGTFLAYGIVISPSSAPQPVPGTVIADLPRNQMHDMILEILTPEKVEVGTLYGFWMGAGASAPGAPTGAGALAVLGGTGAYVGVHGQGANVGSSNLRIASMMEDPSRRRVNGGGKLNLGLNLSGPALPEVTSVFHADFTTVTSSSPARSGEILILRVKAGWAVQPPLDAGQTFPQQPLSTVSVPVEATMNDVSCDVVNVVGWPGTKDQFRVDVRVPSGLAPGAGKLQVNGAYLPGAAFTLPMP